MSSSTAQASQPPDGKDVTQEQKDLQRSAEKGKAPVIEVEETDLMDLKAKDMEKPLEVKVYRKWTSRNVPDPNPTGLCFMLLDRKGSAIQANVQLWDMRQFDTSMQVGSCYRIERFGCKNTDNWQRTLNNPLTLLLGRYTLVTPIEDNGFANHYFNFVAYNEISQRADTRDYTLTDYIGVIRNISHIRESGDPTTNRILRRTIDLQNLNGNVLTLTVWNEMASNFPLETMSQLEQPIILAVTSCWARRFSGGLQLSATPATFYYINPDVEEAHRIRELYNEMVMPMPALQIPALNFQQPQHGLQRVTTPLNIVMQTNPDSLVQQFTVQATIQAIDEQMAWYFNRCRTCGNKVTDIMPHRHCQQPGVIQKPNYSYCFKVTLADETGNIIMTCFSPEANSLMTTSVTELLTYIPDPDPYVFPPLILALLNTTHIFHIHLAKGSRRGLPRFILDGAENPDIPALPPPEPQIQ